MMNGSKLNAITKLFFITSSLVFLGCTNDEYVLERNTEINQKNNLTTSCPLDDISTKNRILKEDAYHSEQVNDFASLKLAIQNAPVHGVIYIEDDAVIEIDSGTLLVDKPITLASGRGVNGSCGALIKTNSKVGELLLVDGGQNVIDGLRITGIRFEGSLESASETNKLKGISLNQYTYEFDKYVPEIKKVTIDNCEFSLFGRVAVEVNFNVNDNVKIMDNYFHDNYKSNSGYGVGITANGFALVKENTFENNRHDISCEGKKGSGYEFSYNILKSLGKNENVDTHGNKDIKPQHNPDVNNEHIAGSFFYIHHNTFENDIINLDTIGRNILVRGIPEIMFLVENNKFQSQTNKGDVFFIDSSKSGDGTVYGENVFSFNNSYDSKLKDYIFPKKYHDNVSDITYLPMQNTGANILNMMETGCGNFNGDEKSDIFVNRNGRWYAIDYPTPEEMHIRSKFINYNWTDLGASSYTPNNVKIADFDGDGKTDVFSTSGNNWQIMYANNINAGWQTVNNSPSYNLSNLKFGDFDGDGKTDAFKSSGQVWSISKGATTSWIDMGTSEYDLNELLVGGFNSNATTDVFVSNEINWFYADYLEGTTWQQLNTSSEPRNNLFAGDLDNDGKTDVYKVYGNGYKISKGGTSTFTTFLLDW